MSESTQELMKWIIPLIITNGVMLVGSIIGWILQGKKSKKELRNSDLSAGQMAIDTTADALAISEAAAAQVKEVREELRKSCAHYEREIEALRMEIDELRYENEEKDAMIEALKRWAEKLVSQVKQHTNIAPAYFVPPITVKKIKII